MKDTKYQKISKSKEERDFENNYNNRNSLRAHEESEILDIVKNNRGPTSIIRGKIFRIASAFEISTELLTPINICIIAFFIVSALLTWKPVKKGLSFYSTYEKDVNFHIDPLPYAPAIVFPVSANRGLRLLDAIESFDYPVEHLILHDNSEGEGSVACAILRIQNNFESGLYPNIQEFSVILSQGSNTGASFSWNSLASYAFDTLQLPWIFISNDDLALLPGTLKIASDTMWERFRDHSLILSNSGLPGIGNAFSFFGVSNVAYKHLGSFDENFWPAYHEDCDYLARAVAVGMPWYKSPQMNFIHPIPGSPPDAEFSKCMEEKEKVYSHRRETTRVAPRDTLEAIEGVEDHGYTNRNYFLRKWGNICDADIFFRHPFNDIRNPVSFWAFDEVRRSKIKSLLKTGVLP